MSLGNGSDGYEVARRMRESLGHRNSRIVAVSGFSQDADRARAAAGFDAHLAKPLDLADLDRLIASWTSAVADEGG